MDSIKGFINKHKWLVTISTIVFVGLPQYIDSVWDLAEKIKGSPIARPHPNIAWAYFITIPIGLIMFGIAIWAMRSNRSGVQSRESELAPVVKVITPSRLEHDGVLWEYAGLDTLGHVVVKGPLCPKDLTPLTWRQHFKYSDKPDKVETNIKDSFLIYVGQAVSFQLTCLECKAEYSLGAHAKRLGKSRNEAGMRFEGMRRRGQQT